jgi:hypothetical protein
MKLALASQLQSMEGNETTLLADRTALPRQRFLSGQIERNLLEY